jgi:hypothetical protein
MPDAYVVTTPTTTVTLGAAGRTGQLAFTVSNIAGRPMRTRLRLVPQEPAQIGWLAIQGGEERMLALGATENFAVTVTVPADVPAGSYTFRADAVGEDSPDEDFATGPTVSLTVPAAEAKPKFPWWIVVAAVVVLAIGAGLFFFIKNSGDDGNNEPPQKVAIENLVGQKISVAKTKLEQLGLTPQVGLVATATRSNDCEANVVVMFPSGPTEVDPGSTVQLGVSPLAQGCLVIATMIPFPLLTANLGN